MQQTVDALRHKPFLPAPDRSLADTGRAHDLRRALAIGRGQNNPSSPDVLLRAVAVVDDHQQTLAISRVQMDGDTCAHTRDSHTAKAKGIPLWTLMSASIH